MAATTTTTTNKPSSTTLLSLVALLALLVVVAAPARASQLNLYKGKWCTESFTSCWDRECCDIPSDAVSYRFYYNEFWRAYLFANTSCIGSSNVLANDVECVQGVDFKSAKLTDGSASNLPFAAEE